MDESDPRQLGRLMRRMSEITGEPMEEEMQEAVRRLEAGEDPDKVEEDLGDLLATRAGGSGASARRAALLRRRPVPAIGERDGSRETHGAAHRRRTISLPVCEAASRAHSDGSRALREEAPTVFRPDSGPPNPSTQYTVTYGVRPVSEGSAEIESSLTIQDTDGGLRNVRASSAPIVVSGLCITPVPTALPSATPTREPTPTATPVPTRLPAPIFLPLALRETCVPGQQRVDAALVMDASSSMLELTVTGRPKLAAAVEAARSFLDQLRLDEGDQAAIVSFNSDAWLRAPLTGDRAVLDGALDGVQTARFTRIDRGIEVAREELATARHRTGSTPVIVLLTDGKANPVPVEAAVEQARLAKEAGAVVFTVGLGDELDAEALAQMASRPEFFYTAPDAEELAEIYRAIAVTIPCPATAFWGRR